MTTVSEIAPGELRGFMTAQLIVSAVLNTAISALFVWLMFGGMESIGLWGPAGLAFDLVPTTFMITLAMTIALTLITRKRFGTASVRRRKLPHNPVLRALLFSLLATVTLVPPSIALLYATWAGDWSYGQVMAFKIVYGVGLGFLVTPLVILTALPRRGDRAAS